MAKLEAPDDLIDLDRLNDWLAGRTDAPGSGPITAVEKLTGGSQNNIYRLARKDG